MAWIKRRLVCVSLLTFVTIIVGCCPDSLNELIAVDPTVRLPLDEAPHCYGGEWWYYTGRVSTDDGHGYGIEAVVFHVPRLPFPIPADGWVAHFAILNETTGEFKYEQARWLGPATCYAPQPGGFDLDTPLIQMTGSAGQDQLQAAMPDGKYTVDLLLSDERGPVVHGVNGYVPYGPTGSSFYYSRPRMLALGTLKIDEQSHAVSGHFWFDRQWGKDVPNPRVAWDWFSLRLHNGTSVMLIVFREENSASFGTYIPDVGDPVPLTNDEFKITPTAWWTSPHTGITYPINWDIVIIRPELTLTVAAVANDQELDVRDTTFNVYWEGLCTITGKHGELPVDGLAYVELTNYPP
ncbi:MAG: lipocalin family protein [Planctomycetota bacterium]|jgi:predicted secreted hydrolase